MDLLAHKERQFMRPTSDKRGGFTVVELIIAIGIMSAIAIGLVSLVVSLVGNATRSIETTKQVRETQSALATIRDDLRLANKFLHTSAVSDTDRSSPPGPWRHQGDEAGKRTLILNVRSTNLSSASENRLPLYRIYLSTLPDYGCLTTTPQDTTSYTSEDEYHTVVYYLHNQTLYRRVVVAPFLADISTLLPAQCTGSAQAPTRTCEDPSITSPPRPANCLERDVVLAQNVTEFDILYYNNPSDQTDDEATFNSGAAQADLEGISTVKITIQTSKDIGGRDNEFTSQIRANRGSAL